MARFVHLRLHSSYSLSEGAIKIEDLPGLCRENSMPAVAVSDSNNMFGSLEFAMTMASSGIQPINASILTVKLAEAERQFVKVLAIASDETGYNNLLKLTSYPYVNSADNHHPSIDLKTLENFSEGIILLSGYLDGIVGSFLKSGNKQKACNYAKYLCGIFGDRFYLEIMRHNLEEEKKIEAGYLDLAYELGVPIVATNDIYFKDKAMHKAHEVLLCIASGNYIMDEDRPRISEECYFKTPEEMEALFSDLPEALENSLNIARRCVVMSETRDPMLPSADPECADEGQKLREQSRQGMRERLKTKFDFENPGEEKRKEIEDKYFERLEYELGIIIDMQFPGYFLIVADFIKWAKENDIPVGPGRGSGAGSIVAWCLLITDIDPIRFGLIFERFLNPERVSMPDFDIDFCQERRDEVINYTREKYGHDKVAQIITFGKLQARAVIRDVGRVLQMPYSQVDKISKLVPFSAVNPVTLSGALDIVPELKQAREDDEQVNELIDIALKLEGLHRHASTHAAGVVIGGRDLMELVPLYADEKSDMPIIQYSMKYAELAGLVKFDFLGLKTLTVISKASKLIYELEGEIVKFSNFTFGDSETYKLLSSGKTIGVFQFESAGMRDSLRKLKPDCIEDVIALGALYRPGPMENIPSFIARKHGREEPDYIHPRLENLLKETYGVIIYQEQVMKIAEILGGYTPGAADILRKAMGKKKKEEMDAQREKFVSGALENGLDKEQANNIFDKVAKFAGYGFNKCHAAAYGVISYQTAYLKANYPVEFIVASLNLDIHDTDKINLFIQEAKNFGIEITPPNINLSESLFTVGKKDNGEKYIIFALSALKNVGANTTDEITSERKKNGEFKSIYEFASRVPPKALNKRAIENLIKSGAFDCLHDNRASMLEATEQILAHATKAHEEKQSNQISLFSSLDSASEPELPNKSPLSQEDAANKECEAIGFYLNNHPLEGFVDLFTALGVKDSRYIRDELGEGYSSVKIPAIILSSGSKLSPKGRYVTVQASDPRGIIDASIFDNEILTNKGDLLSNKTPVILHLDVKKDEGGTRAIVNAIQEIDIFLANHRISLNLRVKDDNSLKKLSDILKNYHNTSQAYTSINIIYQDKNNEELNIELPGKFNISKTISEINQLASIEY
jgi:DNA polymerase-3 subunit alpha